MIGRSQLKTWLGKDKLSCCCSVEMSAESLWRAPPLPRKLFTIPSLSTLLCPFRAEVKKETKDSKRLQLWASDSSCSWFTLHSESRKDSWGSELLPSLTHSLLTFASAMRAYHNYTQVPKISLFHFRDLKTCTKNSFPQLVMLMIR